jgi:tetratricopeptide (TPR) repeat protein
MWQTILDGPCPEWIRLDLSGWHELDSTKNERVYGRAPNDLLILRCAPGKPALGYPLHDLANLRALSRLQAQEAENKLVSLEPMEVLESAGHLASSPLSALSTLRRAEGLCAIYGKPGNGMYWAEIHFPFLDFGMEICLFCRVPRGGVVGGRDAAVFLQTSQAGLVHPETCAGFYQDAYDPKLREGPLVRSLADSEIWDELFPTHEISRLRGHLRVLGRSLSLHPFLGIAPRYTGEPTTLDDLLGRARADLKLNRLEQAADNFELALALRPDCVEAHEGRGWALLLAGRSATGIEHAETAIRLAPGRARAYQLRGRLLAALGRKREALLDFARAAALLCPGPPQLG